MKTAIVTTTIRVPRVLENYVDNFKRHGHAPDAAEFIVIGDLKSPSETGPFLAELAQRSGFAVHWWDAPRQRAWLGEQPELDRLLPWNSVQRRNLGYLQAALLGAETIVTIDDDNWTTDDDYLGGHALVGETRELATLGSSSGWFNSASLLTTEPARPLYHRGFPTGLRGRSATVPRARARGRVVVNAGLWLDVPDADAMTHVDAPCSVTGFAPGFDGCAAVAHKTQMVFNSQNTAFHRDLLPAMFLMPMGGLCGSLVVGRYDDIWMGIFVKQIADHLGDYVTVGRPLVRQIRNEHDLLADMLVELPAQRITNKLAQSLARVKLRGTDYAACYLELVEQLAAALPIDGYTEDERRYLAPVYAGMRAWVSIAQGCLTPAT
jgi:hypothetical protein